MPGVAVEDEEEEEDAGFEDRRRQGMVLLKRPAFCQRQMSSRSSRVCVSLRTRRHISRDSGIKGGFVGNVQAQRRSCRASAQNIGPEMAALGIVTGEQ